MYSRPVDVLNIGNYANNDILEYLWKNSIDSGKIIIPRLG